jgi:hypothetical protein
VVAPVLHK